jgi:hypothetical protein
MRGNFRTVIMSLSCLFNVDLWHFCGICLSGLVISGPVLRLGRPLAAEFRRKTLLHIARCYNIELKRGEQQLSLISHWRWKVEGDM